MQSSQTRGDTKAWRASIWILKFRKSFELVLTTKRESFFFILPQNCHICQVCPDLMKNIFLPVSFDKKKFFFPPSVEKKKPFLLKNVLVDAAWAYSIKLDRSVIENFFRYLLPKHLSYFCLQQMALLRFFFRPTTLCHGVIRTQGRVAPDRDLWRMLNRLSYIAAA